MNKSSAHIYFDPKSLGKKMKEISVDVIRTERQHVTSRWFHANDADLFVWQDENSHVIKQQVSFSGLIIEWNVVDGIRTGVLVEEEQDDKQGIPGSEIIRFDRKLSHSSVKLALELVDALEVIDLGIKRILLHNFEYSPSLDTMSSQEIFKRYDYLKGVRPKSFWQKIKIFFSKKST